MISNIIKYLGREYKLISKYQQGTGEMYVFKEIVDKSDGLEKLSDECKIFQVYRNDGKIKIEAYNGGSHLSKKLRKLILNNFLN